MTVFWWRMVCVPVMLLLSPSLPAGLTRAEVEHKARDDQDKRTEVPPCRRERAGLPGPTTLAVDPAPGSALAPPSTARMTLPGAIRQG